MFTLFQTDKIKSLQNSATESHSLEAIFASDLCLVLSYMTYKTCKCRH